MFALTDLFPETDYRFQMRFEREPPGDFFKPTDRHHELIAQRAHWLQTDPQSYAALVPEGIPLLDETIQFAKSQTVTSLPAEPINNQPKTINHSPLFALGQKWEPDFLLLRPDASGSMRLVAGCVCFPSSWSLEEKIGNPVETIHSVVPALNEALGKQIHGFLSRLRPGIGWLRANWGLSRSPELNQHPRRALPRLDANVGIGEIWLRVEHQSLQALPSGQGVLFGIRIAVHPLRQICDDHSLAQRMAHALTTMPEPMAQYKNISAARDRIIQLLQPS